jgi:non-lysosomal glucosylceramidase
MPAHRNDALPYSTDELLCRGPQRAYKGLSLREIAFPLGGIGTGCVSLGGGGQLRDWEIFNRPDQGFMPEFTFVTLRAQAEGREPVTKVVQSPSLPPFGGPFGTGAGPGRGFPHFDSNTFRGEYPFAFLDFTDSHMPLKVSLEAFNPFIPRNDSDSGLPVAILIYRLQNTGEEAVEALLASTMENPVGHVAGRGHNGRNYGQNRNLYRAEGGLQGIVMDSLKFPEDNPQFGSLVMATPCEEVSYTGELAGPGFAVGHHFWDAVHVKGRFDNAERAELTDDRRTAVCGLGMHVRLGPGESAEVPLLIAWYFPNYAWGAHLWDGQKAAERPPQWLNYYATQFKSAWDVAAYVHKDLERLRRESRMFHDALFGSTLPAVALDAASSQLSTLKSCTCLRLEDGTFYGFEGCGSNAGCCHGSCTHVWNYQQALPFLFPALERSMRSADYKYNLREEDGRMCFRIELPLGNSHWGFHACVDGQLGGIIKAYRDWLLCGDDEWLRGLWPSLKKALAYTWVEWDPDRDGVIDGVQHNTYDIEFQGANPLSGAFYMGALRAAEEMARYLGDGEAAADYRKLFEKGSAKLDKMVFNGDYYYQVYDPEKVTTQQFGEGCLSDQMLGQWLAAICRLGYLFEPDHVRTALANVFRFNWRASLADHANPMRIYAINDEAGLLMATWPRGNRPLVPTMYSDEVWTGIEYQVASHLIMEGFVEQGLAIVKGARDRHDGFKRNPWDEPECGSHYARAMSSWGLVIALSGYFTNASQGLVQFAPQVWPDDFRCFWSNDAAWGTFSQGLDEGVAEVGLEVLHGEQPLKVLRLKLDMPEGEEAARAALAGKTLPCSAVTQGGWTELRFAKPLRIPAGKALSVRLEA